MKNAFALTGLALALLPMTALAAPMKMAQKTTQKPATVAVQYQAACGMTYSAAEAKKDHYVCPMDHSKLVPMKTAHK